MQKELDSDDFDDFDYDDEMFDSDDGNFQMDMQESGTSAVRNQVFRPFYDEIGASKRLKNYKFQSFVNLT